MQSSNDRIKSVILAATKNCKSLNAHLREEPDSLDWLAERGSMVLFNLAIFLDDTFDRDLLEIVFSRI